ncbi:MAG: TetR/AcrR family transcriptional regulator [Bacteroidetes bacterium]|nr:TetR/AcrR family transcriptional regulator [Bacteroidota bacterium]
MSSITSEPEKKILDAAKAVFEEFGYNGARMQKIADVAGISKASLHYYFRNKDNLFDRIFDETMSEFMLIVSTWTNVEEEWDVKLRNFIIEFYTFLKTNSLLFILREINRNPELLKRRKPKPKAGFLSYFENLKSAGVIRNINVPLIYVFMHSLCSYPLLNRSLFKRTTGLSDAEFETFMDEYPNHVADFLIEAIKKTNRK